MVHKNIIMLNKHLYFKYFKIKFPSLYSNNKFDKFKTNIPLDSLNKERQQI